jgi:raffinose/stachyose/melibiose transport system permease protein
MEKKVSSPLLGFFAKFLIYALAIIWLVITLYPFLFLIQNSLKITTEFYQGDVWTLPKQIALKNYANVLAHHFFRFVSNSVFVTSVSLTLLLLMASAASFGLSRIPFRGRNAFYLLFVCGMTIPVHITLIPVYMITRQIGLYDSLWGLIGPYVASALPSTVFILTAFMREIPGSLEEAAYIDGATRRQVYWNIVLPISRPALIAVGIFSLVAIWNEFIFALTLINTESSRPLTLAIWNFQGQYSADIPAMMAALLLSSLPILVLYGFAKEKLIEGLTAGAIKG